MVGSVPRLVVEHQGDFKRLSAPHHQVVAAQPLGLMGNVVVIVLEVHQLQPAAVRACKDKCREQTSVYRLQEYSLT